MTREEAIKNLGFFLRCHESWLQDSTKEAIEMAIAALRAQQEPVKLDRSRWERLTEKRDGQWVIPLRQDGKRRWALTERRGAASSYLYGDHANRLAAYEDTGLMPDEITTGKPGCVFYCNRRCNLDGDWCPEGPGCQEELDGETANHLLALISSPNTPLTLEELREMDGEPVYITRINDSHIESGWALVHMEWCGCKTASGCVAFFERYGEFWRAYRSKPEEGASA